MGKSYMCISCGKMYKNSASLATHKYQYHVHSSKNKGFTKPIEDTPASMYSDTLSLGDISSDILDIKSDDNKTDIQSIDWAFNHLKDRVEELESKVNSQSLDTSKQKGGAIENHHPNIKMNEISKELWELKFQSDLNKSRIELLQKQIQDMAENSEASDSETESSICAEDLIDEMIEIRDLFITKNFETLKTNIKGLKQTITLILRTNIGLERLSSEEIDLLKDITHAPRCHAKQLLRENFSGLSSMFTKMNLTFDNVYEDQEILDKESNYVDSHTEEDSSEGSENEKVLGQNSDEAFDNADEDTKIFDNKSNDPQVQSEEDSLESFENELVSGQNSDTGSDNKDVQTNETEEL